MKWISLAILLLTASPADATPPWLEEQGFGALPVDIERSTPIIITHIESPVTVTIGTNTFIVQLSTDSTIVFPPQLLIGTTEPIQIILPTGQQLLVGTTEPLSVRDDGNPSLAGKTYVSVSSDAMVVSGTLTLTGLGKTATVMSFNGDCTYTMPGGDSRTVSKGIVETDDLDYIITNPSVTLTAKDPQSTCQVRIRGAN